MAAIGLRHGPGTDIGERRSRLRLGQAHRAEIAPFEQRLRIKLDLLFRAMFDQQIGCRHRQQRIARRSRIGGLEPCERSLVDDEGQLRPAKLHTLRCTEQHVLNLCELGNLTAIDIRTGQPARPSDYAKSRAARRCLRIPVSSYDTFITNRSAT